MNFSDILNLNGLRELSKNYIENAILFNKSIIIYDRWMMFKVHIKTHIPIILLIAVVINITKNVYFDIYNHNDSIISITIMRIMIFIVILWHINFHLNLFPTQARMRKYFKLHKCYNLAAFEINKQIAIYDDIDNPKNIVIGIMYLEPGASDIMILYNDKFYMGKAKASTVSHEICSV